MLATNTLWLMSVECSNATLEHIGALRMRWVKEHMITIKAMVPYVTIFIFFLSGRPEVLQIRVCIGGCCVFLLLQISVVERNISVVELDPFPTRCQKKPPLIFIELWGWLG